MGGYKSLSFFRVIDTEWFHTFTEFRNRSDIGSDVSVFISRLLLKDSAYREWVLKDSAYLEWVLKDSAYREWVLKDNAYREWVLKDSAYREWVLKDSAYREWVLKDSAYREWVLKDNAYREWVLKDNAYRECVLKKDKLDKHYARCMACEILLIFYVPYCWIVLIKSFFFFK